MIPISDNLYTCVIFIYSEIALLKSLEHDNIVHLQEISWENDDCIYLIFELMANDLRTYMDDYEPIGIHPTRLKSYFYQITVGLEFCHKRGVLHRDLKPENLLIDYHGNIKVFNTVNFIYIPFKSR